MIRKVTSVQKTVPICGVSREPPPPSAAAAGLAADSSTHTIVNRARCILTLQEQHETDDQREQGDALDQRGRDQHRRLDRGCRLRLAGDAVHRARRKKPDPDTTADDGDAGAYAGTQPSETK